MHKYILEPYRSMASRHRCPSCGKARTFSLYVNTTTMEPVHGRAGRCNREIECGYHYTPKSYFNDNGIIPEQVSFIPREPIKELPASFIDKSIFDKSLQGCEINKFVIFLKSLIDPQQVEQLIAKYFIGTSNHWKGSTVFWQIDTRGNVHAGKIMLYNEVTGKRVKEPFHHITWMHKSLKLKEFNLKQTLFGEHLLIDKHKPVAIVESEKTAIISSIYLPHFIWVAVGSLQNLSKERCAPLKGRNVLLYPDLNAYDKWVTKGNELGFKVSDFLERRANDEERKQGLDIADLLIKEATTKRLVLPSK